MNKIIMIKWIRRLLGVMAGMAWIMVILEISRSSAPFIEQAPYCMGSTMLIFGFLTALHKGLDYWSLEKKE